MTTSSRPNLPFPVTSERLIIRPFVEEDAPLLAKKLSDYHEGLLPEGFLIQEARSYIRYLQTQKRDGELNIQLFTNDDEMTLVGSIRASRHEHDPQSWEIGYEAVEGHRGNGYITEGLETLKGVFKEHAGARRFAAAVAHWNDKSQAVMQRTGFTPRSRDDKNSFFECRL